MKINVTEEIKELILPSVLESVEKAAVFAAGFGKDAGLSEDALHSVDMAVREAVANAVKHGNKLDSSKNVEITFNNLPKGLEITVRDFGEGFAVGDIPDPTNPENLLKANGRGILFMRSFMEEVAWFPRAEGGMKVVMCKLR